MGLEVHGFVMDADFAVTYRMEAVAYRTTGVDFPDAFDWLASLRLAGVYERH